MRKHSEINTAVYNSLRTLLKSEEHNSSNKYNYIWGFGHCINMEGTQVQAALG